MIPNLYKKPLLFSVGEWRGRQSTGRAGGGRSRKEVRDERRVGVKGWKADGSRGGYERREKDRRKEGRRMEEEAGMKDREEDGRKEGRRMEGGRAWKEGSRMEGGPVMKRGEEDGRRGRQGRRVRLTLNRRVEGGWRDGLKGNKRSMHLMFNGRGGTGRNGMEKDGFNNA